MTIRKKHISRYYTIVEVMVAMGIFLVMMTIMMQFFTSAQKVWNSASKRNFMYADARVAMNVMTREIQSMLYDNDDDGTGIYPFWLEWIDIDDIDSETRTTTLKDYFIANKDLPEQGSPAEPYLTALNFISTSDLKPVDEGSDVCEIRYRFVPAYFEGSTPYSISNVKGGKLERSCTAEYWTTGTATAPADYNFAATPYQGSNLPVGRLTTIWPFAAPVTAPFQTVISGVYSMRFTCYKWGGSGLVRLDPMDRTSTGEDTTGTAIADYNLAMGTPVPVAIRIDMKLMDPKDLKSLIVAIDDSNSKQIKNLKQKMRTFSKVIYLGKNE